MEMISMKQLHQWKLDSRGPLVSSTYYPTIYARRNYKYQFYNLRLFVTGKRRRTEMNFPGSHIVMDQIKNGTFKKRIGLIKVGGPPVRHGSKIIGFDNEIVGLVTSGCPSPSLGVNVAMGYVQAAYAKSKTDIKVNIRDNLYNAQVTKMPFVEAKYFVKPKSK